MHRTQAKNPFTTSRIRHSMLALFALFAIVVAPLGDDVASAQPRQDMGRRLRWGIEGGGGGDWGTPRGPSLGLFGQIGLQLDDRFAIFYQPSLLAHSLGTNDDADLFLAFGNLAMFDFTARIFQIGLGGGFDVGRFANCANDPCTTGERSIHPALGGRVALILPLRTRYGRFGIPFAFHVHTTFLNSNDRLTALLLTIGIERF